MNQFALKGIPYALSDTVDDTRPAHYGWCFGRIPGAQRPGLFQARELKLGEGRFVFSQCDAQSRLIGACGTASTMSGSEDIRGVVVGDLMCAQNRVEWKVYAVDPE